MQRVQVFLHEEQYAALKQLAHFSGMAQSDLIRQGVDLLLKKNEKQQLDWKRAVGELAGIWQDHSELATTQQAIRGALTARLEGFARE